MALRLLFCCIFFSLLLRINEAIIEKCGVTYCVGEAYVCINDECYCAEGYTPNPFQTRCLKCPGLGEKCFGTCCGEHKNGSLQCRQGVCQPCYDSYGNWICRDSLDQMFLVSSTQIIMAAALILGIITTFILLYRLCAATANLQPVGTRPNYESRLSIGSLQIYVEERLRDAPPRYTRTAPAGSSVYPASAYLNAGFIHDSSVPPPAYTPSTKPRDTQSETLHI
ncbi:uncharacterized protein LOC106720697 [Papilio machaon]|uniref:uncharacterized protein LOC106720697 n=1 Tax=Papilio machaon TaxID=76193 RepID=UPI001E6657E2|nr:uncharacterized protein LOC106720697 [Papilio machaon]